MLGTNKQGVFLALFNWNDEELGIHLSGISTDKIEVFTRVEQPTFKTEKQSLSVQLKPRTSVIFKLNNSADFDKVRKQLTYRFDK
jgi:hypothetical protein